MLQEELGFFVSKGAINLKLLLKKCAQAVVPEFPSFPSQMQCEYYIHFALLRLANSHNCFLVFVIITRSHFRHMPLNH